MDKNLENKNNNNSNKTSTDALTERLNRIKNDIAIKEGNNNKNEIIVNNNNLNTPDIKKLKDKLKLDNAPPLKEIKEMNKSIQEIKTELNSAENKNVTQEKFSNFINRANEMSKNYEKQLQYYSIYNGKYNSKDLLISSTRDITALNERYFSILSDKKKIFENELNKLNMNINQNNTNSSNVNNNNEKNKNTNTNIEEIEKLYKNKIDNLFKENQTLNKVIEKMNNQLVVKFQMQINEYSNENTTLKQKNGELEEQLMKVKFIFTENSVFNEKLKAKEIEITELNKQQITSMNKIEKANQDIKKLNEQIKIYRERILEKERKYNEKVIELKNLENALDQKENVINEKNNKINEQDGQIKLLYNDSIQWEQKYNDMVKENENFKKYMSWSQELVDSFKRIETLSEQLSDSKKELEKILEENNKYKDINQKLTEELNDTKRNESKLTKENSELKIIKNKYTEIEEKLKNYTELKKENESYKKQFPEMKAEYEKKLADDKIIYERELKKLSKEKDNKISELKNEHDSNMEIIKDTYETRINKLNEETEKLKDDIITQKDSLEKKEKLLEELNLQLDKKTDTLSNLKKSYDDLTEKLKSKEEKLQFLEKNEKKNKSVFDEEGEGDAQGGESRGGDVSLTNEKITSTFDQFSFTKEVLNDYLYCLYLFETTISINSLVNNIMGNLNLYSTYSFKTNKLNPLSNYPLNSIQNEFLEDIYFVAFDKYISNKIMLKKNEIYINGFLDKKILKANFEDFDQGLISEICLELINKNIIKKLKSPKTLEQLAQIFNTKYTKKFDFEGQNLNDFLFKKVIPIVKKRISRYDKNVIDEMRTLVELSLHNIHDGKIIIDGEEVYSFEKFFEQYNNYNNFSERIIQFEIEKAIVDNGEAIDNIKHTLKYYSPQIIRIDKCFSEIKNDLGNNTEQNMHLCFMNKVLCSINYYLPKVTQFTLTNNNLDKIFNSMILPCIKLIKNLNMLNLSNNKLNEENIKGLFGYLKQNDSIKRLYLDHNNITSASGYYMADSFKKNKTIEILDLSYNKLNESGFDAFLNILQNDNTTLKDLSISFNQLVSQDFKSLSKYLNSNPSLKKLDISGNKLGPQDANDIGVTFKKLTNLEELKLNQCGINDESITQLFNFFNESSIQHLEIDSNDLGMTGPMAVMKKIQINNKIKYFSYKNMALQPYFIGMIIKTLTDNQNIEKINLMENKIKDEELKQLSNATINLKNKKVILSKDKVSPNAHEIINGNKNIILQ